MSETPRQKGRPKDPLKTQAILQAARKLFLEQGLEVTTAEIARVAGVAKATLYANFSDKEHLIEAVLRQESDLTISDHDFAQRHHLPLIEVLTAFGYRFVRFINQRELTGWDRLIASAAVRHPDLPGRFLRRRAGARAADAGSDHRRGDRSRYFTSQRSAGGCRRTGRFMAGNDQPGDKTWRKTSRCPTTKSNSGLSAPWTSFCARIPWRRADLSFPFQCCGLAKG
ncbi:TetR family transcriptional regulator [Klebsiella pneumoniae]|uniref:TetR family transcriptional regulator n=1 Tax=Klebsiella pneumoniae TaxID=573 RepID=A0A378A548_KLEPN|nr:TetR family transcriptional regulator [Klebsiella pneumoniae]